eukprot:jgi/Bigna1/137161/aug1.37_g11869
MYDVPLLHLNAKLTPKSQHCTNTHGLAYVGVEVGIAASMSYHSRGHYLEMVDIKTLSVVKEESQHLMKEVQIKFFSLSNQSKVI